MLVNQIIDFNIYAIRRRMTIFTIYLSSSGNLKIEFSQTLLTYHNFHKKNVRIIVICLKSVIILQEMNKKILTYEELQEAPQLQVYKEKPIENFGLNLLQSMGFTAQRGIGHNKKNALSEPLVLKPRPRGLGLGAEQEKQEKIPLFEVGNYVIILKGQHEGLVGVVIEVKQHELAVELEKSKSVIKAPQQAVKKISKEERKEMQVKEKNEEGEKKKKRLKWIVPNIRVKIVDKNSKYYLKKVVVNEVLNEKQFQCIYIDDSGQKLFVKDLREKDVQTVIPKPGYSVIVLRGSQVGQRGKVMSKDKQTQKIVIQTDSELQLLALQEDDLCQYVD